MRDVIVVGAGPAGLFVADTLFGRGYDVQLLEAGPRDFTGRSVLPGENPKPQPEHDRSDTVPLRGAERASDFRFRSIGANAWWARAHAVCGRGNLWGGWLARFGARVFEEGCWPYGARTLAPSYRAAESWLGAVKGDLHHRFARAGADLQLTIRPGTFATRLGSGFRLGNPRNPTTDTIALGVGTTPSGAWVRVLHAGRERTLRARGVVLAASPIETARLLLESGVTHPAIGHRLTDHHMLGYVLFEPNQDPIRMPGLVPRPTAIIPRFVNTNAGSKRRIRGGYSLELLGPAPIDTLSLDQRRVLGLDATTGSITFINAIGEQWPDARRFVDLAPRARDELGRRVPQIHLGWTDADRRIVDAMKSTCREVATALASAGAELMRLRDPFVHPAIYHPAGTVAMGNDHRAPCDRWGALRDVPNVWVADASVLPSGGDGHPTLTVLAHAWRVSEAVHRRLGRRV